MPKLFTQLINILFTCRYKYFSIIFKPFLIVTRIFMVASYHKDYMHKIQF